MTMTEALEAARAQWGPEAFVKETVSTGSIEAHYYNVGSFTENCSLEWYGEGSTWEEAFAKAEIEVSHA